MSKCNQEKRKMIGIQYHTRFVFTYFILFIYYFFFLGKLLLAWMKLLQFPFPFFFIFFKHRRQW